MSLWLFKKKILDGIADESDPHYFLNITLQNKNATLFEIYFETS